MSGTLDEQVRECLQRVQDARRALQDAELTIGLVLARMASPEGELPSFVEGIVGLVMTKMNVTAGQIRSASREQPACAARMLAMYLLRRHTTLSLHQIAQTMGRTAHKTTMHAVTEVASWRATNASYNAAVSELEATIEHMKSVGGNREKAAA